MTNWDPIALYVGQIGVIVEINERNQHSVKIEWTNTTM